MKNYQVLVRVKESSDPEYKWLPVRPTYGAPYLFTFQEAQKYLETYENSPPYLGLYLKIIKIQ